MKIFLQKYINTLVFFSDTKMLFYYYVMVKLITDQFIRNLIIVSSFIVMLIKTGNLKRKMYIYLNFQVGKFKISIPNLILNLLNKNLKV